MSALSSINLISSGLWHGLAATSAASSPAPPIEPAPPGTEYSPPRLYWGYSAGSVHTYTGAFTYSQMDVDIPGRGPSPAFLVSYNSNDTRTGPFSPGWTHSYNVHLARPSVTSQDLILVGPQGRSDLYKYESDSYTPPPAVYATLVKNADNTYTVTHKDQTVWSFDGYGRLTRITDRYGNYSELRYNGTSGKLEAVTDSLTPTDPVGRGSLTLAYDGSGRLHTVTDWASRVVTYDYDSQGRLWKIWDRENQPTTFGYDGASSRLATITDARGVTVLTNSYDGLGRVLSQQDAAGKLTTYDYSGGAGALATYPAASYEPAYLPTIRDTYEAFGPANSLYRLAARLSKPTSYSSEDVPESFGYDANANLTSYVDGRGNRTDLCYDVDYSGAAVSGSKGNLTRVIAPSPAGGESRPVALYRYDAKHNLIQEVAPRGVPSGVNAGCTDNFSAFSSMHATDYVYDGSGVYHISTTNWYTDPDAGPQTATTSFGYDDAANLGRVTRVTPPRGSAYATTMAYFPAGSRAGMLQRVTDGEGGRTEYDYDSVGRRVSMVDPNGFAAGANPAEHTWSYEYDREDRLRFQRTPPVALTPGATPAALVTEYRYDGAGNRTAVVDAKGQLTTYEYDPRGNPWKTLESSIPGTSPDVVTVSLYDDVGYLWRVIRASGTSDERATDYEHDGLGRPRREVQYPDWPTTTQRLVTTYGYDRASNRTSERLPDDAATTYYGYDHLDRLVSVVYGNVNTPNVTYIYDANGNRTSMSDGTGTTSYIYDELDRYTSVLSPVVPSGSRTVGYRYDPDGNRRKLIYPDGTAVNYSYDGASRLSYLVDWAGRQVSYQYHPDGLLKQTTNFNDTGSSYGYDAAGRLSSIIHTGPAAPTPTVTATATATPTVTATVTPTATSTPVTGLVAAYSFDEGSGTIVGDSSGRGNAGTISGAAWTTSGRVGGALSFDGTDDWVAVPDAPSLDLTTGMTLEAWVRPTTLTGWREVILKERPGDMTYSLYASSDTGLPRGFAYADQYWDLPGTSSLQANAWTHLALTYDASVLRLYVNGSQAASTAASGSIAVGDGMLMIGGNSVWGEYFAGLIDEVKVYNRALSQAEIQADMGMPVLGLMAAYSFDEGSGTTLGDSSGWGNAGSISGAAWTTSGKYGSALSFDGADDWVLVNDAASLDLTTAMTLEAWVYPTSLSGWRTVILKERSGDLIYSLYASSDTGMPRGYVYIAEEQDVAGSSSLPADSWSHLAATYGNGTLRLYVNGSQVASRSLEGSIEISSGNLMIGGNSIWDEWFAGLIDEVRIYNRVLSQAEIQSDMATPVGGGQYGSMGAPIRLALMVNTAGKAPKVPPSSGQGEGSAEDSYMALSEAYALLAEPATMASFGYSRDAVGNVVSAAEVMSGLPAATRGYTYDGLYQLTGASDGPSIYQYDKAGNRKSVSRSGVTTSYEYDRADRLSFRDGVVVERDPRGSLPGLAGSVYHYDRENRLFRFGLSGDPNVYLHTFDGDGLRVARGIEGSSPSETYLYDVSGPSPRLLADGSRRYVYGVGLAYAVDSSDSPTFYHADGTGSVRAITDGSGSVVQTYRYDEFGRNVAEQGSLGQPVQYLGAEEDPASGLLGTGSSVYDPILGRFLGRARRGGTTSDPLSLNKYLLFDNNQLSVGNGLGESKGVDCGDYTDWRAWLACPRPVLRLYPAGSMVVPPDISAISQAAGQLPKPEGQARTAKGGSGAGQGGAGREPRVTLYRAVDEQEYADITNLNAFRGAPSHYEGKLFVESIEKARDYGVTLFASKGSEYYVVRVTVPKSIADKLYRFWGDSRWIWSVDREQLAEFNAAAKISFLR